MSALTKTEILNSIRHQVKEANVTNITRTNTYHSFYKAYPEIDWALLAHLVSRNGGWQMTDLCGEWLPKILPQQEIEDFFIFLERCNWLIFQDAYPQLLLYAAMQTHTQDFSSWLPELGVSEFMIPIWSRFWNRVSQTKRKAWKPFDTALQDERRRLTWALIINEQNYIHQRVITHPYFVAHVLERLDFTLPEMFSLQQVLFPYQIPCSNTYDKMLVLGIAHFEKLSSRIQIGKTLYHHLFADPERLKAICRFCEEVKHTGSRSDYWPHRFTSTKEKVSESSSTTAYSSPYYSPTLEQVWSPVRHKNAGGMDWFCDVSWYDKLVAESLLPVTGEAEYESALDMIKQGTHWFAPFLKIKQWLQSHHKSSSFFKTK
ncbi:DUF2515 family protein [Brevibacillus laterosporus]|uniref:DUF2515 family protein n=1 Tax=Brevibacillus laterosporus TaxID=1465 RepID=UPI000B9AECCB|nr:DUF2515 family protein [Brevibacillus laterosporus]